jgi:glutamyl-tRNA synthetase
MRMSLISGYRKSPSFSFLHIRAFSSLPLKMAVLDPVRVRFAPSPTGSLHVGGARTALFNWLLAKKTKGTFIVRVEDTDEARSTKESEKSILDDLRWLGLDWDEGPDVGGPYAPYRQSERKEIYQAVADQLVSEGKAYRCFCTEEELEKKKLEAEAKGLIPRYDGTWRNASPQKIQEMLSQGIPHTVRFKIPDEGRIVSIDDIVRGRVTWNAEDMLGDFIILRSNGMPVYNFCVSVDDMKMKITHVIRAEEHLSNTLRQILLLEALNYKPPTYAHCSLIMGSDRSKLSKRHGATSVQQFSQQGFVPAAMINYLANLGFNDGTNKEIYQPSELVEAFDLNRIVKSSAIFDMVKLTWINAQHVRNLSYAEIEPLVFAQLTINNTFLNAQTSQEEYDRLYSGQWKEFMKMAVKIAQRDMDLTTDTVRLLNAVLTYDPLAAVLNHNDSHIEEMLSQETNVQNLKKIIAKLIDDYEKNIIPDPKAENFSELWSAYMKGLGKNLGLKGKSLFHPMRFCVSGRMSGPELSDQLKLISLAEGIVEESYPLVNFSKRMDFLKSFSLEDAIQQRKLSQPENKSDVTN